MDIDCDPSPLSNLYSTIYVLCSSLIGIKVGLRVNFIMDIYNITGKTLSAVKVKPFRLEKDIQKLVEDNIDRLFDYELVKSEFKVGTFRLDTLCFDKQNNSFVIIEYKKDKNFSVIDQGFSYLSTVFDNKSDLILEYQEKKGKNLKRDSLDWSQTKVLFISPSFSIYQIESINFKDLPIELFEIKQYENNTITLHRHKKRTTSTSINDISKSDVIQKVKKEVRIYTEEEHLNGRKEGNKSLPKSNPIVRELYFKYKDTIINTFDDVEVRFNKYEVALWVKRPFLYFYLGKDILKIWFNLKMGKLDDPKNICRDVSKVGHWGVGDYELNVKDEKNFEYVFSLIRQTYEHNL